TRAFESRGARRGAGIAAVIVLALLFSDYRLQPVVGRLLPQLSLIGFAYIGLRAVELLRGCWEDEKSTSLISCVNYLTPFHMLAAGPIQSWRDFQQCDHRTSITQEETLQAAERIAAGLFKKFVIASALRQIFLTGFESDGLLYVLEVHVFYLWLFLDFSGYSDIAIGVGVLIGAPAPENFKRPLLATSLIDFWDRWHITLSQFLRRNVFIPLEIRLLRKTNGKFGVEVTISAFIVTFVVSAAWHSISPGFLFWGLSHAVGVSIVVIFRHVLKRRLGTARFNEFRSRTTVRYASILLTFEYVTWTLIMIVVI
ncbi:MAG: hypothetical protein MK102_19695, partial [Fuerstiella sp.]|nr:hypothetical protein [Fuerstiella sp.]